MGGGCRGRPFHETLQVAMQLNERVVIITGAASGLGRAAAFHLRDLGARVAVWDRSRASGEDVATQVGGIYCEVRVEDPGSAKRALSKTTKAFAPPSVLVNCAGVGLLAPTVGPEGPHEMSDFERVVAVNLLGSFNCARLVAAAMTQLPPNEEGERGVIIHTTSILATDGQAGQVAYAASKSGVAGMVLPMARDLARFGIRCVAIAPGMFDTPMIEQLPATMRERLVAAVPFPSRLGRPAEFARMVQAVCENTMLNGTVIRLDGAARMPARA